MRNKPLNKWPSNKPIVWLYNEHTWACANPRITTKAAFGSTPKIAFEKWKQYLDR